MFEQVEGGIATILSEQAAALEATGVGSMVNSLWLNGAKVPDHSRLATPQAKMGYSVQMEMQRLQVGALCLKSFLCLRQLCFQIMVSLRPCQAIAARMNASDD